MKPETITTPHGTFSTEICPRCEPTVGYLLRQLKARCATHVKVSRVKPGEPLPPRALSKKEWQEQN